MTWGGFGRPILFEEDTVMIGIKYVGRKPFCFDRVAHSGKTWNGNGDVQDVTVAQARRLLKHPDEFALSNEADAVNLDHVVAIMTTDEDGKDVTVEESDLKKPLERMSRAELKVYAKVTFNKDLAATQSRKLMLDQIEEWQQTVNPSNTLAGDLAVTTSAVAGATAA